MNPRGPIHTNDPGDAKVASMLGRIEEHMGWVKEALDDGKANFRELREVSVKLTNAVERLTKNADAHDKLELRVRAVETEMAESRPARKRWQKIHDTFVFTIVKYLTGAGIAAAAAAYAAVKVAK